jgi:hypothetical protein
MNFGTTASLENGSLGGETQIFWKMILGEIVRRYHIRSLHLLILARWAL